MSASQVDGKLNRHYSQFWMSEEKKTISLVSKREETATTEEAVSPYNFVGKLQDHQQKWAKQKYFASLKTFLER